MTPDREQRRLQARAEGRRAAGLGPAIVLNAIAGVTALLCGGLLTILNAQDAARYGTRYGAEALQAAILSALYTTIAGGQLLAARALARRHAAHRAGRADDRALARVCGATLAIATGHVLVPLIAVAMVVANEASGIGGRPSAKTLALALVLALPAEVLPVAALLLTARAWRRLAPEGEAALVGADGAVHAMDAEEVRQGRRRALATGAAAWCLGASAAAVGWGVPVTLLWMPFQGRAGATAVVLLALHGGMAGGLALAAALLWNRRDCPAPEQRDALGMASSLAWIHAAVVAFVVLGLAAAVGGSLGNGLPLLPFAELAPILVFLRLRQAARELDRLAPV